MKKTITLSVLLSSWRQSQYKFILVLIIGIMVCTSSNCGNDNETPTGSTLKKGQTAQIHDTANVSTHSDARLQENTSVTDAPSLDYECPLGTQPSDSGQCLPLCKPPLYFDYATSQCQSNFVCADPTLIMVPYAKGPYAGTCISILDCGKAQYFDVAKQTCLPTIPCPRGTRFDPILGQCALPVECIGDSELSWSGYESACKCGVDDRVFSPNRSVWDFVSGQCVTQLEEAQDAQACFQGGYVVRTRVGPYCCPGSARSLDDCVKSVGPGTPRPKR